MLRLSFKDRKENENWSYNEKDWYDVGVLVEWSLSVGYCVVF